MELDLFFLWKCSRPQAQARMTLRERTPAAARAPDPLFLRPTGEATFACACLLCMLSRCSIFRSTGSPGHYDSRKINVLKCRSTISNGFLQLQCLFMVSFCPSTVVLKPKDDREGGEGRRTDACPSLSASDRTSIFLSFLLSSLSFESFDVLTLRHR